MRKIKLYQHLADTKDAADAVALINAMKFDTPWKPKPPGSEPRGEKTPPQLPAPPQASRDDLRDRRDSTGPDPGDGEQQRPGAA
jgi:hypothetical protein